MNLKLIVQSILNKFVNIQPWQWALQVPNYTISSKSKGKEQKVAIVLALMMYRVIITSFFKIISLQCLTRRWVDFAPLKWIKRKLDRPHVKIRAELALDDVISILWTVTFLAFFG
jgi:hypothetical protein